MKNAYRIQFVEIFFEHADKIIAKKISSRVKKAYSRVWIAGVYSRAWIAVWKTYNKFHHYFLYI